MTAFTNGNIAIDLTAFGSFGEEWGSLFDDVFGNEIFLASLFDASEVSGIADLTSFQIGWEDHWFAILDNGHVHTGWEMTETGFRHSIDTGDTGSSTPEPATLIILGLGLAGLGLAVRCRRRLPACYGGGGGV